MLTTTFRAAALLAAILTGASSGALADTSRAVVDANAPPYAAIGRVNNSVGGHCSGVLLAPRIAVTAAHCLYNRRTKRWLRPEAIHFLLGYRKGDYVHHAVATAYETGQGYDPDGGRAALGADWALLTLSDAAPASIAPMRQNQTATALGAPSVAVGFARGRPYLMTVSAECRAFAPLASGVLAGDCESPKGTSGGPLIALSDDSLSGIQVAAGVSAGRPVSFTVPAAAWAGALARLGGEAPGD